MSKNCTSFYDKVNIVNARDQMDDKAFKDFVSKNYPQLNKATTGSHNLKIWRLLVMAAHHANIPFTAKKISKYDIPKHFRDELAKLDIRYAKGTPDYYRQKLAKISKEYAHKSTGTVSSASSESPIIPQKVIQWEAHVKRKATVEEFAVLCD